MPFGITCSNDNVTVMTGRLLVELQQTRPFASAVDEAYLNLVRTTDLLRRAVADLLKPHDLTSAQYNVLRILRGARGRPVNCGDIASRLVTFEPDVTRLIDRLALRELVLRSRDGEDKRQVLIRITPAGLELLKRLDEPVSSIHARTLGHLGDERLGQLIDLLESIRHHAATSPSIPESP